MDVSSVSPPPMNLSSAAPQLQTAMQMQVVMLREAAQSQQQIAQLLVDGERGQHIDVRV